MLINNKTTFIGYRKIKREWRSGTHVTKGKNSFFDRIGAAKTQFQYVVILFQNDWRIQESVGIGGKMFGICLHVQSYFMSHMAHETQLRRHVTS